MFVIGQATKALNTTDKAADNSLSHVICAQVLLTRVVRDSSRRRELAPLQHTTEAPQSRVGAEEIGFGTVAVDDVDDVDIGLRYVQLQPVVRADGHQLQQDAQHRAARGQQQRARLGRVLLHAHHHALPHADPPPLLPTPK